MFTELNQTLHDSGRNTSYTENVMTESYTSNAVVWDWGFLGIFLGCFLALGLTAYAVRISPVFYWLYGIFALIVLVMGVILSSIWQDASVDAEFAATLARFPITDAILGSYFPIIAIVVTTFTMVLLMGKPPGQEGYV